MTEINYFFKNKLIKYLTSILKTYETNKLFTRTKSKNAFDPVTKFDLKIEKKIKNILEKLKITGHVVIQGIIDKKNSFQVIECNARFGGASNTSIEAGLDSFYWSIIETKGEILKDYNFYQSEKEIKKIRIEEDIYFTI